MYSWLPTQKSALGSALSAVVLALFLTTYVRKDVLWGGQKLELEEGFVCEPHQYTTEIISVDPLLVYINDFVSPREKELLIALGSPDLAKSEVFLNGQKRPSAERTSQSAGLDPSAPITSCILSRARNFMGSLLAPDEDFGIPQMVRYEIGQKFDTHHDWYSSPQRVRSGEKAGRWFNRVASFFVYLEGVESGVQGGGTWFPHVKGKEDSYGRWEKGMDGGTTFLPREGNAVFWVNLHSNGTGDERVVHAGLALEAGRKTAMNIWPRKLYGER